jgi:hypothetical protein
LPIHQTSGTSLPFPDEQFDIVLSFDALEHIPDTDAHHRSSAGAEARRLVAAADAEQVDELDFRDDPLAELFEMAGRSLFPAQLLAAARRLSSLWPTSHSRMSRSSRPYRESRCYLGLGLLLLTLVNPDRLPMPLRTIFISSLAKRPSS